MFRNASETEKRVRVLTSEPTYRALQRYYDDEGKYLNIKDLFDEDPERFDKYSMIFETPADGEILIDYSKNIITDHTVKLLFDLARARGLDKARDTIMSGNIYIVGENEAMKHIAMRNRNPDPDYLGYNAVVDNVTAQLAKMKRFTNLVFSGFYCGVTGKIFTDVVNLGFGACDLGPQMVTDALKPFCKLLRTHYVSNYDGGHLFEVLKKVEWESVLFIVASKLFTIAETVNARAARSYMLEKSNNEMVVPLHFAAISTHKERVNDFGIENRFWFEFWDHVGGRYSLWSPFSLPICLSMGWEHFEIFLDGANFMDTHFKDAPLEQNIPVILALLGIWYTNMFHADTHAILPYDQYMQRFAAFCQLGEMESNGKFMTKSQATEVTYNTAPIVWGDPGTTSEHSFYQLLHQGTHLVPCDFIAPAETHNHVFNDKHHKILLAHFLAQLEGLMVGRTEEQVRVQLEKEGLSGATLDKFLPHRTFTGNRPTNAILFSKMTPFVLGFLIAMYEHKSFVQGVIWDVKSFDRSGIELNKELSKAIKLDLNHEKPTDTHDSSTNGLINFIKDHCLQSPEKDSIVHRLMTSRR